MQNSVNLRIKFLTQIYTYLVDAGYTFLTIPDIREYKHGNLKFTDDRLIYKTATANISITLEHYFIKREGWHPIYWGLQAFAPAGKNVIDPLTITIKDKLLNQLELKLQQKLPYNIDLSLVEPKYGWFAWHCFKFTNQTSDMDNERINNLFATDMDAIVNRFVMEFMFFLKAWEEVVFEN